MQPAPSRPASPKPTAGRLAGGAALTAIIAAAVAAVSPYTRAREGDRLVGYRDQGGVPTAGNGHTGADVRVGMRITDAQRAAWLKADLTEHTAAVLAVTPELADMPSALKAAGDFHFNAGKWWIRSPMAARFHDRHWRAGCEAFRGYVTLYRAPRVVPGQSCRTLHGQLYCEAKGLVTRREGERAMCLAGLPR